METNLCLNLRSISIPTDRGRGRSECARGQADGSIRTTAKNAQGLKAGAPPRWRTSTSFSSINIILGFGFSLLATSRARQLLSTSCLEKYSFSHSVRTKRLLWRGSSRQKFLLYTSDLRASACEYSAQLCLRTESGVADFRLVLLILV